MRQPFTGMFISFPDSLYLLQRGWELPHHHNDQGYSLSRWIGQVGAARDIQVLVRYRCPVFSV